MKTCDDFPGKEDDAPERVTAYCGHVVWGKCCLLEGIGGN